MFITILLVGLAAGFALTVILLIGQINHNIRLSKENSNYLAQIRNLDQDSRNEEGHLHHELEGRKSEVIRLTNKMIEVQNNAKLIEKDAKARIAEFNKRPVIACMTDNQVQILAEMLAVHVRQIIDSKKEFVN